MSNELIVPDVVGSSVVPLATVLINIKEAYINSTVGIVIVPITGTIVLLDTDTIVTTVEADYLRNIGITTDIDDGTTQRTYHTGEYYVSGHRPDNTPIYMYRTIPHTETVQNVQVATRPRYIVTEII